MPAKCMAEVNPKTGEDRVVTGQGTAIMASSSLLSLAQIHDTGCQSHLEYLQRAKTGALITQGYPDSPQLTMIQFTPFLQ